MARISFEVPDKIVELAKKSLNSVNAGEKELELEDYLRQVVISQAQSQFSREREEEFNKLVQPPTK